MSAASLPSSAERRVAAWLFACCAMIAVMVLIGGLTRLTDSGLSMVDWRPFTGWLPPLDEAAWARTFEAYRQYPEFRAHNRGMDLAGFKSIFWLEYLHRVWGRLIGLAFALPLAVLALTGQLRRALLPRLLAILALGAMQGVLGWYMVMSGLVERPDVSQYRLSAHLLLAFALYGYVLWVALGLVHRPAAAPGRRRPGQAAGVLALLAVAIGSGGFVAGLDAGLAYNTFPRMGGRWIPEQLLLLQPWWLNFLENMVAVQFAHRLLALACAAVVGAYWWAWRRRPGFALPAHLLLAAVLLQAGLGIATLINQVPLPLAAAHQLSALALFTAAVFNLHVHVRGP